jgi:hypothetical protein
LYAFLLAGFFSNRKEKTPMLKTYTPSESELMEAARVTLRRQARLHSPRLRQFNRAATLRGTAAPDFSGPLGPAGGLNYIGPRPEAFDKPRYGTPAYAIALKVGWITAEEEKADRLAREGRRKRSLQTCHRASLQSDIDEDEAQSRTRPRDSGAYVPQLSARLENDPNLTDGARRCARKIAELTYRQNRDGRSLDVTVTYLMKALGRSRRTVQRYLRLLEREGYVAVQVIGSTFSRMCVGLVVHLCVPLFARHHRKGWPPKKSRGTAAKPGASRESHNQSKYFSLERYKDRRLMFSVQRWFLKCSDGVLRAFRKDSPNLFMETAAPLTG